MTLTAAALFLPADLNLLVACGYLVAVMAVVNLPSIAVWALFGSALRSFLTRPARRVGFNIVMALALVATGVTMVM
jgi:threonine/homoserine/homoserine lactone efflux protein